MGNYRFRLSDMMPNAWFHKLKDMGRGRGSGSGNTRRGHHSTRTGGSPSPRPPPPRQPAEQHYLQPRRASYYFPSRQENAPAGSPVHPRASDTLFPVDPPRKSRTKARRRQAGPSRKLASTASARWSCRAALGAVWEAEVEGTPDLPRAPGRSPPLRKAEFDGGDGEGLPCFDKLMIAEPHFGHDCDGAGEWSPSCSWKVTSSASGIAVDTGSSSSSTGKFEETKHRVAAPALGLTPILTKPVAKAAKPTKLDEARSANSKAKNHHNQLGSCPPLREQRRSHGRSPPGTHRIRVRPNSPRLASGKIRFAPRAKKTAASTPRGCLSESFAVVKSSSDPHRDFRDSMVEMIVENNIRASGDLEELLAGYLALNSNEYHDVIVKVFEQVWFDLPEIRRQEIRKLSRCT